MNSKVWVIIVLAVLIVGGAFYVIDSSDSEKNIDDNGWTTYKNNEYNFELKYKPEWKYSENGSTILFYIPGESVATGLFNIDISDSPYEESDYLKVFNNEINYVNFFKFLDDEKISNEEYEYVLNSFKFNK